MKRRFYIKTAFVALIAAAGLSSCLKDDKHYVDFAGATPLIELPSAANVGGSGGLLQSVSFDISSTPTPLNLMVNLAAPKTLSTDVTVKLSVDAAALAAYNTANGTNYELLPAADYSSTLTATIAKGTNSSNVVINLNTTLIDPSKNYALPLTITDGGGQQISNYKTVIFNVGVKNKYDGVYTVTGTMNDIVNPALTGNYPRTVDLVTTGANTNAYFDEGLSNYAHAILNGGAPSSYGLFAPVFTFDANNKVTAVVNKYGQPSTNNRSARLDITGINAVSGTPGTTGSVIKVKYVLVQGTDRTFFDETFTFKGKRQ